MVSEEFLCRSSRSDKCEEANFLAANSLSNSVEYPDRYLYRLKGLEVDCLRRARAIWMLKTDYLDAEDGQVHRIRDMLEELPHLAANGYFWTRRFLKDNI